MSNVIIVNGKRIEVQGDNISIKNGEVYVDGKKVDGSKPTSELKIIIEGNVGNLTVDNGSVEVKGMVTGNVDCGGSFKGHDVMGSIDCGGSVQCNDVGQSIDCGGSVQCGNVGGEIDAGGSVNYRK